MIATVDDLTDMLDFDSEDIDGMDDNAGEEEEQPPTRHWTTTSSYDIYMVDTPKEDNGEDQKDTGEDRPPEKQPKRVSGAALNQAMVKTEIPAHETIALRMMPMIEKTTPPSQD